MTIYLQTLNGFKISIIEWQKCVLFLVIPGNSKFNNETAMQFVEFIALTRNNNNK